MGMPSAPHLDFAGEMRAATGLPVFHAARITDVATARHAIAAGKLDMVGMTRAHIADPHIVKKIRAGQEHTIRPCVGRHLLPRPHLRGQRGLVHPQRRHRPRGQHAARRGRAPSGGAKVVVVGAGPAGLEAARVSAERGHEVVLFEATEQAGGQIRLASRSPRRRELIGIVDWRVERLAEAGVELRFSSWAEADDVLGLEPDVVFIATGGIPNTDVLEAGEDLRRLELGRALRPGEARRAGAGVRRQRRAPGAAGGGAPGRERRRRRARDARALLRGRDRRPQPRRLRPRLPAPRRQDHDQHPAQGRPPPGQRAGRRRWAATTATSGTSGASTRSWSSTARCRWPTSTTS